MSEQDKREILNILLFWEQMRKKIKKGIDKSKEKWYNKSIEKRC
jgi:hypothetical protein